MLKKLFFIQLFLLSVLGLTAQQSGTLDSSFGLNGKVITPHWGNQQARSMMIQPDGKILVTGTNDEIGSGGPHFMVIKYNQDGSLDAGFGSSGKVFISVGLWICHAE